MKFIDKSLKRFLRQLSAKTPVPGGGSVSALFGAVGCGLLSMVAQYTVARKGFNGYKERAKKALKESEKLKEVFAELIEKDILAYEKLSRAFKRHKSNIVQVQPAIKKAITPPSKVCISAHKAIVLALELAFVGNKSLISDVCIAAHAFDAAYESSLINIKINLKLIRDKKYVVEKTQRYTDLHKDIKKIKAEILSKGGERMFES